MAVVQKARTKFMSILRMIPVASFVASEGTVAVLKALPVNTVMVMVEISVSGVGIRGREAAYTAPIRSMRGDIGEWQGREKIGIC